MCNTVLLKCNGYVTLQEVKKRKRFCVIYAYRIQGMLGYLNGQLNTMPSIEIKKHDFSFDH